MVFALGRELVFPPPEFADRSGLLAVGGDLSADRLVLAYSMGIFPWYGDEDPILWWSPDPRLVLYPGEFRLARSLRQTIGRGDYRTTIDAAFNEVIGRAARVNREKHGDTWITDEMLEAYMELHSRGYAHSVEAWDARGGGLAGGLYGVSLGSAFFGESMFSTGRDASKVALAALVGHLKARGCRVIDCQVRTAHLVSLGAREVPRAEFLAVLGEAIKGPEMFAPERLDKADDGGGTDEDR